MTDTLNNWIVSQGSILIYGLVLFIGVSITAAIWNLLGKIAESELNIVFKCVIALIAVPVGWISIGAAISGFLREYTKIVFLAKALVEGAWICAVFYRTVESKAPIAVVPFAGAYVAWEGYVAYLGIFQLRGFTYEDTFFAVLSGVVTVVSYVVLLKMKPKIKKDRVRNVG